MKLEKIFGKAHNIVIGAVHFSPLLGYPDFPGFDAALANALVDLKAFEDGGADAVIIENNYDIPHKSSVDSEVAISMAYLGGKIKQSARIPIGVSVLWNDYRTALSLSRAFDFRFIRVPVFVDKVKTNYGVFAGDPEDVVCLRKHLGADGILLFTDIHVKHAEILSPWTIEESAMRAIWSRSDALIVTGRWTGDAPEVSELERVRNIAGDFPIFCGSGVDENNAQTLFRLANGAIVSTSVKEGAADEEEVNIKPYCARIDSNKVKLLVARTRS